MPYFKNDNINILFIHIPKTGGTSIEYYFSNKYNIKLDENSLCEHDYVNKKTKYIEHINTSLQHMTYQTIFDNIETFKIDKNDLKILTIVRNPYERAVSDLFFSQKEAHVDMSKKETYELLKKNIGNNFDNHTIPQHEFLFDSQRKIDKNIKILHMELLDYEMNELGYNDFNKKYNYNNINVNYFDYLNDDSIKLINEYYKKDFEIFGYDVL